MDSHLEVIDAFIDGERVDVAAFKAALSQPDGRDYFVDAWTLREGMQQDVAMPSTTTRPVATTKPSPSVREWMIAAALVAGVGIGYATGYRALDRTARPPAASPTATVVTPAESFPPPAPTRVIQVEFQIDNTRNGGD